MTFRQTLTAAAVLAMLSCAATAQGETPAPSHANAKVLILGDSQISFGAGAPYAAFFASLGAHCGDVPAKYHSARASAIGVRSTALHHWTTASNRERGAICDVDKKYGVNAGAYGVTSPERTFVQIGKDRNYPFCPKGRTSLRAVFDAPAHDPDMIVLSFLGNAIERWQSADAARADWNATTKQLPNDVACIVMTSIPSYDKSTNTKRLAAQDNLARAIARNPRCAFVPGLTKRTIAAFQGNKKNFRTNSAGRVTDPGHPSEASAGRFVKLQTPALCTAVARVLSD